MYGRCSAQSQDLGIVAPGSAKRAHQGQPAVGDAVARHGRTRFISVRYLPEKRGNLRVEYFVPLPYGVLPIALHR
jgi:hypothetical protein